MSSSNQQRPPSIACIIMASGSSRRFGSNKLLADFGGHPLVTSILASTIQVPFSNILLVTRCEAVATLCQTYPVEVLLHDKPNKNDAIALGVEYLQNKNAYSKADSLEGILFCLADQPFVSKETLCQFLQAFSQSPSDIYRLSYANTSGNPILFGKSFFQELTTLPAGKGGAFLAHKYPEQVHVIPTRNPIELYDIDTQEDLLRLTPYLTI